MKKNIRKQRPKKQTSKNRIGNTKKVQGPTLRAPVSLSRKQISNSLPRTTIISNREMFPNYTGTSNGSFKCNWLTINFGKESSFPWISGIAQHYDMYRILKLAIEYKPSCGTSSIGTVSIAFDYDTVDAVPVSLDGMSQNQNNVTGSVWAPISNSFLPKSTTLKKFFVRETGTSGKEDRWNDAGCVYIATEGYVGKPGNIYVNYTVELINAQEYHTPCGTTLMANPISKDSPINTSTAVVSQGTVKLDLVNSSNIIVNGLLKGLVTSYTEGTGLQKIGANLLSATGLVHKGTIIDGSNTMRTSSYETDSLWDRTGGTNVTVNTGSADSLTIMKNTFGPMSNI